jgi:polyisoprenoid-binding protein YceI
MSTTTAAVPVPTTTTTWNIDPAHTVAEFKVKHMMIANVKGHFSKVSGVLVRDESDPANDRVEATIEAASIQTRDDQRDGHLKSADFFHVEKFPTLHFKSTGINVVGDGELSVDAQSPLCGGRANAACQGSLGEHPDWDLGEHQDQSQGFRFDLERCS